MTAIVGLWDGEIGWMAADGRGCWGQTVISDERPKIARSGEWVIGVSGGTRASQVMHRASLETCRDGHDVATLLRDSLREDGFITTPGGDSNAIHYRTAALAMSASGLWLLCSEFAAGLISANKPVGVGSGGDLVQGAAAALLSQGISPAEALTRALWIAAEHNNYCGPPAILANTAGLWRELSAGKRLGPYTTSPGIIRQSCGENVQ